MDIDIIPISNQCSVLNLPIFNESKVDLLNQFTATYKDLSSFALKYNFKVKEREKRSSIISKILWEKVLQNCSNLGFILVCMLHKGKFLFAIVKFFF